jgi:Holliday junction resolvase RusA-like endonuclease
MPAVLLLGAGRTSGGDVVMSVTFFVAGIPIPQGSKAARVQGKRAVLYDDNAAVLKPWRAAVTRLAEASWLDRPQLTGAVLVEAVFVFARPKTVTRRFPIVKPDLDKLLRAIGDGITDAGVWKDDSQIVRVVTEKVYGAAPGVHVTVTEVSVDQPTRGEQWLAERERLLAEMGMSR